jgi:hypothetical protein
LLLGLRVPRYTIEKFEIEPKSGPGKPGTMQAASAFDYSDRWISNSQRTGRPKPPNR